MGRLTHATEVLSIIDQGYGYVDRRKLIRAQGIGREFHKHSLGWVKGYYLPEPSEPIVLGMLHGFQEWFGLAVDDVLCIEEEMEDPNLGIVGRIDIIPRLKGEDLWRIVDLKSVAVLTLVTGLQLAIYEHLATLRYKIKKWAPRAALQFKKNGGSPFLKEYRNPADWDAFLAAYSLFNHLKR